VCQNRLTSSLAPGTGDSPDLIAHERRLFVNNVWGDV